MKEGDIVVAPLAQADGQIKNRPALILRVMPRFGDLLVCGFSTQLSQQVAGFDEIILSSDADFVLSGLTTASLIRLGFLTLLPLGKVAGSIGSVSAERHERLLRRLSGYLVEHLSSR